MVNILYLGTGIYLHLVVDLQFCLHVVLSVFSEEYPPIREEDALTKWVSDPANTAWMESKEQFP